MSTFRSDLSGKEFPENEKISAKNLRQSLLHFINKTHPEFSKNCLGVNPVKNLNSLIKDDWS